MEAVLPKSPVTLWCTSGRLDGRVLWQTLFVVLKLTGVVYPCSHSQQQQNELCARVLHLTHPLISRRQEPNKRAPTRCKQLKQASYCMQRGKAYEKLPFQARA